MRKNFFTKSITSRRQVYSISLALIMIALCFPAHSLYADTDSLDKCLLDACKYADDSMTIGELRKQCKEELETNLSEKNTKDSSASKTSSARETNKISGNTDSPGNTNGPVEVILKTFKAKKPAYFPHQRHQGKYTCGRCHHGKDSDNRLVGYTPETKILKCIVCHNAEMPNKELNGYQLIGHKLCRDCHRNNQDLTSAKCSTCHRKNL